MRFLVTLKKRPGVVKRFIKESNAYSQCSETIHFSLNHGVIMCREKKEETCGSTGIILYLPFSRNRRDGRGGPPGVGADRVSHPGAPRGSACGSCVGEPGRRRALSCRNVALRLRSFQGPTGVRKPVTLVSSVEVRAAEVYAGLYTHTHTHKHSSMCGWWNKFSPELSAETLLSRFSTFKLLQHTV